MALTKKFFAIFFLVLFVSVIQTYSKPLEESKSAAPQNDEVMEAAESQNPFLPRFAMRVLKQRRQEAQRRNNQGQRRNNYGPKAIPTGQRRVNPQVKCSHQGHGQYYKK